MLPLERLHDKLQKDQNNLPNNTPRSLNPIQAAKSEPLNRLATNLFSARLRMLTRSEFALTILQASLASVHVLLLKINQELQVLIWKTKIALRYHFQYRYYCLMHSVDMVATKRLRVALSEGFDTHLNIVF